MTPQERQLVDDVFDRLSKLEGTPRDPDAVAAITDGLRKAPNAIYPLVQTVLLQDEALKRANARIEALEASSAGEQRPSGGFLDSMRETIFGQNPRGSVPNVRPPDIGNRDSATRPVWNSGQVLQQSAERYDGEPYGPPQGPLGGGMGGGGSFLGTAAAAAAGMVGGSLLLNGIRSMMGGSHHAFGDAAGLGGSGVQTPWSDQSGSGLARDAGINDIGSSAGRADDNSRAGLFDTTSNDDDDDRDDMDLDSDDFGGGDGDSDSA